MKKWSAEGHKRDTTTTTTTTTTTATTTTTTATTTTTTTAAAAGRGISDSCFGVSSACMCSLHEQ